MEKLYTELAEKALRGDQDALRQLAEVVHEPLRSYVYRITLSEDLRDDIVQETIVEMFRIFGQLKKSDHFWSWLCKIALNKIRISSRTQARHKELLQEHAERLTAKAADLEGLTNIVNEEIKQAIFLAMSKLKDEQKAVLSMRCYENMSYSQIAEVMGYTELQSRLMFFRAKNNLQKHLFRFGFPKKATLTALLIFGKLTAPSEAVAAQMTLAPAALTVGTLATAIGILTGKTALILITGGSITLGTVTVVSHNNIQGQNNIIPAQEMTRVQQFSDTEESPQILEGHYYYPEGNAGPLMTRLSVSRQSNSMPCKILQNNSGNYFYSGKTGSVKINNYHYWNKDLSVMILPTDDPEMVLFISRIEGLSPDMQTMKATTNKNLLVVAQRQDQTNTISLAIQNYDALMEEQFQYNWPANTLLDDQRDDIHRRGWCLFTMKGTLNGEPLSGVGQIPFVYDMSKNRPAWLQLHVGGLTIVDTPQGAVRVNTKTKSKISYPTGTFLKGLNTPWLGLHCIDTIRREAADKRVFFETACNSDVSKCTITLKQPLGDIIYRIDMNQDLIEKIEFTDLHENRIGEIRFEYLAPESAGLQDFRMPQIQDTGIRSTPQTHWLAELVSGNPDDQ